MSHAHARFNQPAVLCRNDSYRTRACSSCKSCAEEEETTRQAQNPIVRLGFAILWLVCLHALFCFVCADVAARILLDGRFASWTRLGVGEQPIGVLLVVFRLVVPFLHDLALAGRVRLGEAALQKKTTKEENERNNERPERCSPLATFARHCGLTWKQNLAPHSHSTSLAPPAWNRSTLLQRGFTHHLSHGMASTKLLQACMRDQKNRDADE